MPAPVVGAEENEARDLRYLAYGGIAGGTAGLCVLIMFCSILRWRCFRKEVTSSTSQSLDEEGGTDIQDPARTKGIPTSELAAEHSAPTQGSLGGDHEATSTSSPIWAARTPPRGLQGLQHAFSPLSAGQPRSKAIHEPHIVQAGDLAAGGAMPGHCHGAAGGSPPPAPPATWLAASPSRSSERPAIGGRPPAALRAAAESWPIEDIIMDAAKSHDMQWSLRVGSCERSLVEVLVEAFAMLGISSSEELLEQLQSDAGQRENAWIGTRDIIMASVRTSVQEAGLKPDDARPLLGAASGLLSRSLRRFAVQAAAGGLPADPGARPPVQGGPCSGDVGLPSGDPTDRVDEDAPPAPPPSSLPAGLLQEDRHLERAFRIVDRTAAEIARLTAAASKAPRHEAQALFARRRTLEESDEYASALAYIEERMAPAKGARGACPWAPLLCGPEELCDLEPEGSPEECETMNGSPKKPTEIRVRSVAKDDQLLLKL